MSQRTALLIATALTVFMLMVMTGVVWQVFQKSTSNVQALQMNAPAPANATANTAQPTNDTAIQEQIAQRESAYRELIQQANQKLEESYKQQQEMAKQLQVVQTQQSNERAQASQQPQYKVTPDQASSIALTTVPGAVLIKAPELISFQNTAAYEVTLDKGVVYISATTGEVLYNSAAIVVVRNSGSGRSGGGGNTNAPAVTPKPSHESEHEEEHHVEDTHKEDSHQEEHKEERKESGEKH